MNKLCSRDAPVAGQIQLSDRSVAGAQPVRCLALLLFLFPGVPAAEPLKQEGLTVELASEHASIQPGTPFSVGMIFRHEPGFHTYWRQPGIVGLAPSLKWSLPSGFSAGDILWPEPERVKMAKWGAWGFKRDVCLVVDIVPPPNFDPSARPTITLSAKAAWMCCSQTCHPGFADLSVTLPVAKKPPSLTADAPLFATTRAQQPAVARDWRFTAIETADGFTLSLTPPRGVRVPEDAYFFGFARLVDSHAPQTGRLQKDGSLALDLKLTEVPEKDVTSLEGLVWSAKGWPLDAGQPAGAAKSSSPAKRTLLVRAPLIPR
ncbi:MAG: protein-disulfide reductase DsbD domain-containing protein [Verrucomicrobiales bacterium]